MYFIKTLFYLLLFVLTSEIYGKKVQCSFSNMKKVSCGNRIFGLFENDCPASYLIQCGRNPKRMGFVSGEVVITAIGSGWGKREEMSLEEAFELIEDGDCFWFQVGCGPPMMTFEIIDNTPLYKTPLGQKVISYTGYNLEGKNPSWCQYTPIESSMTSSFKSPKRVVHQVGGLQQTVCYGNVCCLVDLRQSKLMFHRVACTALPSGECPAPQECIEDPSVRFEQVAEIEETVNEEMYENFKDQMRLDAAMEQIKQDVRWERLKKRIESQVADKIKQWDQQNDEIKTASSKSLSIRLQAMEEWINARRSLLEREKARDIRSGGNSGIR